jgi:hypothetical protein
MTSLSLVRLILSKSERSIVNNMSHFDRLSVTVIYHHVTALNFGDDFVTKLNQLTSFCFSFTNNTRIAVINPITKAPLHKITEP